MSRKRAVLIALLIVILALLPVVIKKDNIINLAVLILLQECPDFRIQDRGGTCL